MAPTSASSGQPSDKDNWDNGRLAHKQQLLTEIVLRNKLTTLVFDGDTMCRVLEQVLLRSYGVQTQGVNNGRDAVALIAFGAKFNLIIIEKILPIMNGLEGGSCKILGVIAREKVKGRHFWQLVLMCLLRNL
ncbi:hypothetical protein ES319_A07G219700v1 [Gossypium barbadense]|uniref:Response regulatory domain-containing protein n=2 Tax=Gossypium TaxID=3633 RepID=A0A5J5V6P4_GOSBA|nr:hypothetical protein ES319_A07G219700v1 [Gossypium barbadense]TYH11189.1 hypothetical protein ES288_A07G238400v1 [Gossypium darwinii]